MIVEMRNDEPNGQFPVGMRVLAVDDDPICLRLLETLLRKCQYHVTTRDRAIDALELLRENKDKFDLVISDVHMPDMDGFKLLELVGLEMDLPVIMLSANGDTKLVMKGISHGACDYLLKPVRLEELKNIWQHVVRRKKFDKKDQNNPDNREKRSCPVGEVQRSSRIVDSDHDGRLCKRRKDQTEDDDDDDADENGHENEDPSSQKKARVVWSVELHRKFVAAVNQLGFERAVPKKILELMNVEKLTRENVASHLQKYRLYLKRLSSVANQQANMVAALGGTDSAYLRMNSMNFHNFNGSGPFQNNTLRSRPPTGVLGRLNSPAGLGIHGLSSPGMAPLRHAQMTGNGIPDPSKFQMHRDQTGNILQGMPTSLEFDQLQIAHKKGIIGNFSSTNDGTGLFPVSSGPGNNPLVTLTNNSLLLQGHSQEIHGQGAFADQCSVSDWPGVVQSSGVQSTSFASPPPMVQAFNSSNNINSTAFNELQISSNTSRFPTSCQTAVLDIVHHPDFASSSMNPSMVSQGACPSSPVGDPTAVLLGGNSEFGMICHTTDGISGMDSTANLGGSLEDVVTSMIKWEQEGTTIKKGSDLGSDVYPLRTCI